MDRGEILRHLLATYRQHLAAGVNGGVARTYLREIARLESELHRFENSKGALSDTTSRRIEWTDIFSVGRDTIDEQHRDLIGRINQLCDALESKQDVMPAHADLHGLINAAKEHFEHEMAVIKEAITGTRAPAYPKAVAEAAYNDHVAAHERALGELQAIVAKIKDGVPTTVAQYGDELIRWFVGHAIKYDANLKAIFQPISIPGSP